MVKEYTGYDIEVPRPQPSTTKNLSELSVGANRLSVGGGLLLKIKTVTDDYLVQPEDVVLWSKASGDTNMILPPAIRGKTIYIKNIANATLNVYANNSGESILENNPTSLGFYDSEMFVCNGKDWGKL